MREIFYPQAHTAEYVVHYDGEYNILMFKYYYNKKIEKKENNNKSLQQKLAMLEGFGGQNLC